MCLIARCVAYLTEGISFLFCVFPGWVAGGDNPSPEDKTLAVRAFRIIGTGCICYGVGMVMLHAMSSAYFIGALTWIDFSAFVGFSLVFFARVIGGKQTSSYLGK